MAEMGRPSEYTEEIALAICVEVAMGKPLTKICRDIPELPEMRTIYRWLATNANFRQMYARAKDDCADTLADEIIEISDDGRNDTYIKDMGEAGSVEVVNFDHINRSKLRVDARKWIAAKLKPRKYGDKIQQEITGTLSLEQLVAGTVKPPEDRA